MRIKHYLLVLIVIVGFSCTSNNSTDKYELIWSDEFNYEGLPDSTKWDYEEGFVRNKESQYYTKKRLKNTFVKEGVLTIKSFKEEYKDASYTSGSINTLGKFSFKYGKIEVRAQIPTGLGSWPAIWMMGDNIRTIGWPKCGEIDVMENVGHDPHRVWATAHTPHSVSAKKIDYVRGGSTVCKEVYNDYHKFSMQWTPDSLQFYFDDKMFSHYAKFNNSPETWPFDEKMYILLNTALGGTWGGKIDDSIFPLEFKIDYVRVYQKK